MYTIHQEILTPVRAATEQHAGPITHYYSAVHVSVGGVELFYKQLTSPQEVAAFGEERTKQRVNVKLRRGIMYEIEAYLFKIDAYGEAMGPQL